MNICGHTPMQLASRLVLLLSLIGVLLMDLLVWRPG